MSKSNIPEIQHPPSRECDKSSHVHVVLVDEAEYRLSQAQLSKFNEAMKNSAKINFKEKDDE